jgi:prolyl oligopeptidase
MPNLMRTTSILLFCIISIYAVGQSYPASPQTPVSDTIWGQRVEDPFRWLENESDPKTQQWLDYEKDFFKKYNASIPGNINVKSREYTSDANYLGSLYKSRNRFFEVEFDNVGRVSIFITDKAKSIPSLLCKDTYIADGRNIVINGLYVSYDLKNTAVVFSAIDSMDNEARVVRNDYGMVLKDHLKHIQNNYIAWFQNGFFYTRNYNLHDPGYKNNLDPVQKIYYHKIGTLQDEDSLIFFRRYFPDNDLIPFTSYNEKYLFFLDRNKSKESYSVFYKKLADTIDAGVHTAILSTDRQMVPLEVSDDVLYAIGRGGDRENGRIEAFNTVKPDSGWHTLIPVLSDARIEQALILKDKIVIRYLQEKKYVIGVYDLYGQLLHFLEMPDGFYCGNMVATYYDNIVYLRSWSYVVPPVEYSFDLTTFKIEPVFEAKVNYDINKYTIEHLKYNSKDGEDIPITIAYSRDTKLNGESPLLLEVDGGFNTLPRIDYDWQIILFLDKGGIYANANVRGQRKENINWHKAGMGANKGKPTEDVTAAVKFLIEKGYSNSSRVGVLASGDGALAAANMIEQNPSIVRACGFFDAPFDLIRSEKFTKSKFFKNEYGSVSDSADFTRIFALSPYHHIDPSVQYPSLFIVANQVPREFPAVNAMKYIARLQQSSSNRNPYIFSYAKYEDNFLLLFPFYYTKYENFWKFFYHELDVKF